MYNKITNNMKKIFTCFVVLLAIAAAATGPAWGQSSTSTLEFTGAYGTYGATADDNVQWTVTSDGTESQFDGTKGIHYGTGQVSVQYIELSTSGITGTITQVKVNASTASGVTATVGVTVGGNAFGGDAQSLSATATNYTFTGSASGAIVVRVAKPSAATKALYVKSIEVTYTMTGDPASTLYQAALAAIEDNQDYRIQTNVNGTMYYVTTGGLLTSDLQQAGVFHITKTSGGELFGTGFRIDGGTNAYFSNPPFDGIAANLNPGAFSRNTNFDRNTWERQVLYLDGNGKYAIRSCNTQYAESSYQDAGRTFWTYSTGNGVTPCYTYTAAFIWEFVNTSITPHTVRLAEGTEDATSWQGKAGEGEYQALPLEGVAAGTAVTVKYNGTMKVKSVKAVKKAAVE